MLRSAVERQVVIVGEACRRALADTPDLRERAPSAPKAVAMRNRVVHGYDRLDHALVFRTVTASFPPLVEELVRELERVG